MDRPAKRSPARLHSGGGGKSRLPGNAVWKGRAAYNINQSTLEKCLFTRKGSLISSVLGQHIFY